MRQGVTSVPFPNTLIKTLTVEGTWGATPWESRWLPDFIINADVAQLAEQLTCNQQVTGSSPVVGFFFSGGVPEWPKGADCKSVIYDFEGSNPIIPTQYH